MSDLIEIRDLEVVTRIGVHDWERRVRQSLRVDLDLPVTAQRAATTDALNAALDYSQVAERVCAFAAEADWLLLETFAERLAAELLSAFELPWLRLSLSKPGAIPGAGPVRLRIERHATRRR